MTKYGIIGKPLEHSYSARYFTEKFLREGIDAEYRLYEVDDLSHISTLMHELHGFNVTYPYKQTIMPQLHDIDTTAREIGAVNVVCQGKGYNTDWIGFRQSILPHLTQDDQRALVLGTGGVSKAIQYAMREMGIEWTVVSRQRSCSLEDASLQVRGERLEVRGGGLFDLVFIDADKKEYCEYLDLVLPLMNEGGWILADNTLWDGHIIDPAYDKDKQTVALRAFNDKVAEDERLEKVILPLRDGLTVIRVRG